MWFRVFSSCLVLDPSLARRPGKEGLLQLQEHWERDGRAVGTLLSPPRCGQRDTEWSRLGIVPGRGGAGTREGPAAITSPGV